MNQSNIANWKKTRQKGKYHYIFFHGVLGWGLPMFVIMTFVLQRGPLNLISIIIHLVVLGLAGYIFGLWSWIANENIIRKLDSKIAATYVPDHDYVTVDPQNFQRLDLHFYDEIKNKLESLGYRHIADEENSSLSKVSGLHTLSRVMISPEGTISVGIYHYKPGFWIRVLLRQLAGSKVIDLSSELTDGNFILTTTASKIVSAMSLPQQFKVEYIPENTAPLAAVARHQERLRIYLTANPSVQPLVIHTLNDVRNTSQRINLLKANHRQKLGGITEEEIMKVKKAWKNETKNASQL